jgi:hypothetical protein
MRRAVPARWNGAASMTKLLHDFRNLHRAPDDWELREYASHAWRLTRNVWLFMIVFCIVLGTATNLNPAKMFDEYRPFTIYTVILLGVCGVVCAQCARLAVAGGRSAWTLMTIGFFFLALDDLTQIHERLDKLLTRAFGLDPKATLPDLLDAGIVVLYGIVGAIALYRHRRHFFGLAGFKSGIAKAAGASVAMVILDVLSDLVDGQVAKVVVGILEDAVEALAVSWFFCTFVTARFQLRRADRYLLDVVTSATDAVAGGGGEQSSYSSVKRN